MKNQWPYKKKMKKQNKSRLKINILCLYILWVGKKYRKLIIWD